MESNILDEFQLNKNSIRRRELLPTWVKIFIWIFMIFGFMSPVIVVLAILGYQPNLSLYGIGTTDTFSLLGILLVLLFLLKGAVSYGLWMEKGWAINLAIGDAIIGLVICAMVMFSPLLFSSLGMNHNVRLEIIPLYFYFKKMTNIKERWLEIAE